jgi:hypothetical protein
MKESALVLALIAAVAGGFWYFNPFSSSGRYAAAAPASHATTAPEAKERSKSAMKAKGRERILKVRSEPDQLQVEATVTPLSEPGAPLVITGDSDRHIEQPFPPLAELRRGLNRIDLQDRLGAPNLKASTVDRGSMLETYVYERKVGGLVVAYLKDGKLERVRSSP